MDSAWSLNERRGWLTLTALPSPTLRQSRNTLTQKTVGFESEATTRLDVSGLKDGDHAGLLCMGKRFMGVGVCREQGRNTFYLEDDGQRTTLATCRQRVVFLRVAVDSYRNVHQLYYSTDGKTFQPAGEPFSLRMGNWKGSRVGLYSYNTGASQGGKAHFNYFQYDVSR